MTTAIICLTRHGYELGLKVKQTLQDSDGFQLVDFYAPARNYVDPNQAIIYHDFVQTVQMIFSRYRSLVFIMALGIVVRTIAGYIKDKTIDPAVVVMDEAGQNVISVLSGHLGGANSLARFIAAAMGSRPVITTATDVHGLPAVDDLARELNLALDPLSAVRQVNSGMVNGELIHFYSPIPLPFKPSANVKILGTEDYHQWADRVDYNVLITNYIPDTLHNRTMFLRPRNLVAGIGCRAGTSARDILTALQAALKQCRRSILSLRALATIELKAGEEGLVQIAAELKLPLVYFSAQEINNFYYQTRLTLSKSGFVEKNVGVPGVCEPAALLATGEGELILPKQKYPGVTVAMAQDHWP